MQLRIPATIAVGWLLWGSMAVAASGLANVQSIHGGTAFPFVRGADSVAVGSTGYVYVASSNASAVSLLVPNPPFGALSLLFSNVHGGSPDGLDHASAIALSPDEANVYVGSGLFDDDVGVYDALLNFVESEPVIGRVKDLTLSPDGANLYVAFDHDDAVQVFSRDPGTGALSPVQTIVDGVGGVDGINNASGLVVSPDGKHVYVTGDTDNAVAVFSRDPLTGALTFVTSYTDSVVLRSPNDIAISPDGLHVYVAPDTASAAGLTVYSRDAVTGLLTFVEAGPLSGESVSFARGTRAVTVSADGTFVIGGARTSTVLYDRNTITGSLTFVGGEQQRNERVRLSADQGNVYAASGGSDFGVLRLLTFACSASPMAGCRQTNAPNRSSILFKEGSTDQGDRFKWKWVGEATALADAGDPINGLDDMRVCVYDASASPQPVFTSVAPAGGTCDFKPCWYVRGSTPGRRKLKYSDPSRRPDGVAKLEVKEGVDDVAALKVKGQDQYLIMPVLPLTAPVRAQFQSPSGICWEAVFSVPQDDDVAQFKAKSD